MTAPWITTEFSYPRADGKGMHQVAGSTYRGIGVFKAGVLFIRHEKKRLLHSVWSVTHLNTGHRICFVAGAVERSLPIAQELAEAFDWMVRTELMDRPAAHAAVHRVICKHHPFAFRGEKPPKEHPAGAA